MAKDEVIFRFEEVSFGYGHNKPILDEVDCSVRRGSKVTIMGQNGAGKSTIFALIIGTLKPESGRVITGQDISIATARQVIPRAELDLTVREFFEKCFSSATFAKASAGRGKIYDIDPRIDDVLEVVNLKGHEKVHSRIVRSFSGGQQARLLLASALIQNPDLLLLDEPTNNLDKAGIAHLTEFLKNYKKTVIVISHDAEFLNAFSTGVLYLDIFTRKVEQYAGNYLDVSSEIIARVEKENRKNAQLAKEIQENKDKANFFAQKGGQMRLVAKRMREKAEELLEEKVDIRREDKTIRPFIIPSQADGVGIGTCRRPELIGEILNISAFSVMNPKTHKLVARKTNISLRRNQHLLLSGPNGIGKSTLLGLIAKSVSMRNPETRASRNSSRLPKSGQGAREEFLSASEFRDSISKGITIADGVRVGYYRQDFSTLNFEDTVYDSLLQVMDKHIEENMRSTAAGFLITGEMIRTKIGSLSEGQKGLVAFARLVLQKPGLLILDEPTNHINFRHIPIIAEALNKYDGAMILVSHVPDFVSKIRIDEILDLEK